MMNRFSWLLVLALLVSCNLEDKVRSIPIAEYENKVEGFWLGQLVGNIYGLSHEFQYLDEHGPTEFPLGYGSALDRAIEIDGAFSDDDTDLEYMYLLQMEKHGIEPTYGQLRQAWMYHIRDRIWAANRVALTLMHHGYYPPATGSRENNPRWFEIDPQLINEIWAVTAPGMTRYAVEKTEWASRITNDDFGIEPALFYAAMISEGFFEDDVRRLIQRGKDMLPEEGRFRSVIEEMEALHVHYPDDWTQARDELAQRYGGRQPYNDYGWKPIDAVLNGAAAVLALLYGEGDIQLTLDLACAMGWDADNQAATLTGLLGLIHGADAIPAALLMPVEGWEAPFNDRYINVSRHDLPDASIGDQVQRIAAQGVKVVEAVGGQRMVLDGIPTLLVRENEPFSAPLELLPPAPQILTLGDTLDVELYASVDDMARVGAWPEWVDLLGSRVMGVPPAAGRYELTLAGGADTAQVVLEVLADNLASSASAILSHDQGSELEVIRDGRLKDGPSYSGTSGTPERHWYGYEWDQPVRASKVTFSAAFPREEWGWFVDPVIEYQDVEGSWRTAQSLAWSPSFPEGNTKYLQPGFVTYVASFESIEARRIRLAGWSGGDPVDGPPTYGTAITELTVH